MYRSRRLFFWKVVGSLTPSLLLSAKSHARLTYSVASVLATVRYRYQLFAGSNSPHHMASLLLPVDTRLSLDAIRVPGSAFFFFLALAFVAGIYFVNTSQLVQASYRLRWAFLFHSKAHRALILLLLGYKPNPLCWVLIRSFSCKCVHFLSMLLKLF